MRTRNASLCAASGAGVATADIINALLSLCITRAVGQFSLLTTIYLSPYMYGIYGCRAPVVQHPAQTPQLHQAANPVLKHTARSV